MNKSTNNNVEIQSAYKKKLQWLYSLEPRGIQLGLERIKKVLADFDSPQEKVKWVHVAGTNGKGSTASMIASGLRKAGYHTALFTSPHIHRFVERIKIGGSPISDKAFVNIATRLEEYLDKPGSPELTFFEAATCIAFLAFAESKCEMGVLEVGLGGRLDSTNIVNPTLSVITPIAMDHESRLGNALEEIAAEKAGIIKQHVPVIVGKQNAKVKEVLLEHAKKTNSEARFLEKDFEVKKIDEKNWYSDNQTQIEIHTSLDGAFQIENAACAMAVLLKLKERGMNISDESIKEGVSETTWPCRLEKVGKDPTVLLDAAHNPSAAKMLGEYLTEQTQYKNKVLVFGVMKDKAWPFMLETLKPHVDQIIFTKVEMQRALRPEIMEEQYQGIVESDSQKAVDLALAEAGKDGLVIVAGSIFLVSQIRAYLLRLPTDPLIAM